MATVAPEGLGPERISIELKDVPLEEALRQILKNQDVFFFYSAEKDSPLALRVVWAYPKGRGRSIQAVPPEQWAATKEWEGKLADDDPDVRRRALAAVVQRKGRQALDAVLHALEDVDAAVRRQALYSAMNSDLELPASLLYGLISNDRSEDVRFLALQALEGDPNVRAVAEQRALLDPSPHVKGKAREILRRLDAANRSPGQDQPRQVPPRQPPVR